MGGAPLANLVSAIPDEVAGAAIRAAWDAGVRHFDTAPHYGAGLSEHRFGSALRRHKRADYTLSTKVGRLLEPVEEVPELDHNFQHGLSFQRRVDFTYDGTLRSIEHSLHRLGLPRVDIVYIHDCGEDWLGPSWREQFDVAMAGAARALTQLREQGRDPRLGARRQSGRAVYSGARTVRPGYFPGGGAVYAAGPHGAERTAAKVRGARCPRGGRRAV
jgi:D-threo-aldose 1-dehydrogenase